MAKKDDSYLGPFWGAPLRYSTGRDHLGLQATSVATYSFLVPGLTNLTQRARYYSYYPWLVEQYAQEIRSSNLYEFNKFMRRGELLYAFASIMLDSELRGVVGSLFVRTYLKENGIPSNSTDINLSEYADIQKGKKTYWQLSGGAFTQYYLGPLIDIGILARAANHRIPVATDIGREIAKSFEQSIGNDAKKVILSSIHSGKLRYSELNKYLHSILPDKIDARGKEASMLLEQLIPPATDLRGINRREVILFYLSYLSQDSLSDGQYDLPRAIYYSDGNTKKGLSFPESTRSLYGWRFYQISEYVHYALEYVMFYLLSFLHEEGGWITIEQCTDVIQKGILKEVSNIIPGLKGITKTTPLSTVINKLRVYNSVSRNNKGSPEWLMPSRTEYDDGNLARALMLLFAVYTRHERELNNLYHYGITHHIIRDNSFLDILRFCSRELETPFNSFLHKLVQKHIISCHMEVSYRKMRGDMKNTLKFQYEDASLSGLEIVNPVMTSPRLLSVLNFIKDLGLVSKDNKPTKDGLGLINAGT